MKFYRMALGLLLALALSFGARADIPLNHAETAGVPGGAFASVEAPNPNSGDVVGGFSALTTSIAVGTRIVTNQAVDCGIPAGAKGTVWGTSSSYPDWVFILWDAGYTITGCTPVLAGATLTTEQKTRASWIKWAQGDVSTTTTTTTTTGLATTTPVGTRIITNQAVDCGIPAGAKGTLWGTSSSYPDWVFILWDAGYTISTSCAPVLVGATLTTEQKTRASWIKWAQGNICSGSTCTATTAPTLSSLSVSCPSSIAVGGYGSCTASAFYSDGAIKSISPTWSTSNSSALYISYGSLYAGTVSVDTSVTVTGSYTEGSVTKSATSVVLVKATKATLSSLTISGDTTVKAGSSITLTAKGAYSDGSSSTVYPSNWTVSDTTVAKVDSYGMLTAQNVTSDKTIMVSASYTEGTVTKSATWTVTVKASSAALSGLTVSGSSAIKAGDTSAYTAAAGYADGSSKTVSNVQWSITGTGATIDSSGTLTADSTLTADATVTVLAIYTEGTVTKTATLSVKISKAGTTISQACSGTGSNLSEISIVGNSTKQLGEALEVDYCLKNFNQATRFDIYVAVTLPDGTFLFMQSAGFFGMPAFTAYDGKTAPKPYLSNTLIPDRSGPVLQISTLPMEMPTGTYTFYAIPVFAGKDVFNGFNWVGNLAKGQVNLFR